jgi:hypothetical protein
MEQDNFPSRYPPSNSWNEKQSSPPIEPPITQHGQLVFGQHNSDMEKLQTEEGLEQLTRAAKLPPAYRNDPMRYVCKSPTCHSILD